MEGEGELYLDYKGKKIVIDKGQVISNTFLHWYDKITPINF